MLKPAKGGSKGQQQQPAKGKGKGKGTDTQQMRSLQAEVLQLKTLVATLDGQAGQETPQKRVEQVDNIQQGVATYRESLLLSEKLESEKQETRHTPQGG